MLNIKVDPLISIIVPIYNGSEWIRRCLDSLVYQTLENIEIITVNNGSTDDTLDILLEYSGRFPQKVIVETIEHTNGPGGGRNRGLSVARANYIGFADIDDYFDYRAFELMYNKAIQEHSDIVYIESFDVLNGQRKITRKLKSTDKNYILKHGSFVFWNKLFHKSLFLKAGKVPEDIVFEDIAYCSTLISYANKISYINEPLYYYILRDDSGVNDLQSSRILHAIEASKIAIKNCNRDNLDYLIFSIAYRMCYDISYRWTYSDHIIGFLKEYKSYFQNCKIIQEDNNLANKLNGYFDLPDKPMPTIVYINGFDSRCFDNNFEKAFWEGAEIVILNEENCDIDELGLIRKAYDEEDYDFVAKYFACKKIVETGGIYLSPCVEIINSFNCLRYCTSFFGFIDKENYTDEIFGGIKGSDIFQAIVETYKKSGEFGKTSFNLAKRIKTILTIKYKFKLDGETKLYQNEISVLSPESLIVNTSSGRNICKYKYFADDSAHYYISSIVNFLKEKNDNSERNVQIITKKHIDAQNKIISLEALLKEKSSADNKLFLQKYDAIVNKLKKTSQVFSKDIESVITEQEKLINSHINQLKIQTNAQKENDISKLKKEIQMLKSERDSLVDHISNMEASRSWKVTKPLRSLKEVLKGMGIKV